VLVEKGAGENAGIPDDTYREAGAEIVDRETAWAQCFAVKYKVPQPEEFGFFHKDLHLATNFHAEDDPVLTQRMCESGMTGYGFEFFENEDGSLPATTHDDEIAGKTAIFYGAYLLQQHFGGSGTLLTHVAGTTPPKALVIGHGDVGGAAARTAAALGCRVTVLGRNWSRLRKFAGTVPPNVTCRLNSPEVLSEEVKDADLVVGAILISTYDTPPMLDRGHLKTMKKGSMIIDITCGWGDGLGWMPSFHRQTSHEDPIYEVDGVLHCKIDALPAKMPATASEAASTNLTPHLIALGDAIYSGGTYPPAEKGKIVANGEVTHPVMIRTLDLRRRYRGETRETEDA
jgi:alanine dehydrogenase